MPNEVLALVAVIGGLSLAMLGLIQYVANYTKTGDKRRSETFDLLEAEKLENVRLQGQLFIYDQKIKEMQGYARKYYRLYRRYEGMYNKSAGHLKEDKVKKPLEFPRP